MPQEPRQATAATQPYPRGDAIVPQQVEIAPEGFELVNQGRIFTPFVGDKGMIVSPSLYGGANWPPSSYDPVRRFLFVCASDVAGNLHRRRPRFRDSRPDGQATKAVSSVSRRCRARASSRPSTSRRTSSRGAFAGPTSAIAARWRRPAASCSSAATTAG